ncbi:MAG: hypothetical protein HFE68_06160 [Erysipelotrichaceae bacterium]|nr:hypothetical protein [Erysipelotrichaceae bacterium]MCI9312931.1 hypothetical protein [Erysipelotrichaceae bacterium]
MEEWEDSELELSEEEELLILIYRSLSERQKADQLDVILKYKELLRRLRARDIADQS